MDIAAIRDTIVSVNSVENCKIIEEVGEIAQIYVEASLKAQDESSRTQEIKGIIRSIIGAVAIHHNIDLDYRKIKVIDYKPQNEDDQTVHPRIQIVAAYQKRVPEPVLVVELNCLDQDYVGKARLTKDLATSTFNAFVDAFSQMNFGQVDIVYLQLLNNDFMQEKVVLVKLRLSQASGEQHYLLGVSEVKEDLPLAVVKACLNAVNRRILVTS